MTNAQAFDRRREERRIADQGPPQGMAERRRRVESRPDGAEPSCHPAVSKWERRRRDRRVGERRQANLGPPAGMEERRFRPDPRGVVFMYVDDA